MTEVLSPWAEAWTNPFVSNPRSRGQKDDEALLWIAWELGHLNLFKRELGYLQESCRLDNHGSLTDCIAVVNRLRWKSMHSESCKTWSLGALIKSLVMADYYPLPLPDDLRCSVQEVRESLEPSAIIFGSWKPNLARGS